MATRMASNLNAHAKPPAAIREVYKRCQKATVKDLDEDAAITDTQFLVDDERVVQEAEGSFAQLPADLRGTYNKFTGSETNVASPQMTYSVKDIPGLYVFPALLPPEVQLQLLSVLFNRDLLNPEHKTNVHMHYEVSYPQPDAAEPTTYFSTDAASLIFPPKDLTVHKPITTEQYLNRKLRWMTLGGQYDWTRKVYPAGRPPAFPSDIKALVEDLFPMKAEAAIVNLYSPGDTLSLHRDVSEECDQSLVSISLGCDGIFVIGLDGDTENGNSRIATIKLRSGDAVLMSGESRYAWHSVPKVVEGSCPDYLRHWPGADYPAWEGWMGGKRINLNVRQMFD